MSEPVNDDLLPEHADIDASLAAARQEHAGRLAAMLDLDAGLAAILTSDEDGGRDASAAAADTGARRFRPAERGQAQHAHRHSTHDDDSTSRDWTPIGKGAPVNVATLIRDVNASNEALEDQCLRAYQAADIAERSTQAAELAEATARWAMVAHRTIQAERPRRRAPLPRQVILALMTVAMDGVACYFAAQTLDGSHDTTLIWTGLFLAVLAGGEAALDFYWDRNLRTWRVLALITGGFVALLGMLRFWFLATRGTSGLMPAIVGAFLFTGATGGLVFLGYRALRAAETPQAWRARRAARKAWRAARAARAAADRDAKERDRLISGYLGHVRKLILKTYPADVQVDLESAVREHLYRRLAT